MLDENLEEVASMCTLIKQPPGTFIHPMAFAAHGLTVEKCNRDGEHPSDVYHLFTALAAGAEHRIAFNLKFDDQILHCFAAQQQRPAHFESLSPHCAMLAMTPRMAIKGKHGQYKWPKLAEAFAFVTGRDHTGAHDALADVRATAEIWRWLKQREAEDKQMQLEIDAGIKVGAAKVAEMEARRVGRAASVGVPANTPIVPDDRTGELLFNTPTVPVITFAPAPAPDMSLLARLRRFHTA